MAGSSPDADTAPLGAVGSSLSDFLFCTRHSGVKDERCPQFSGAALKGAVRKSAPPLAASRSLRDP